MNNTQATEIPVVSARIRQADVIDPLPGVSGPASNSTVIAFQRKEPLPPEYLTQLPAEQLLKASVAKVLGNEIAVIRPVPEDLRGKTIVFRNNTSIEVPATAQTIFANRTHWAFSELSLDKLVGILNRTPEAGQALNANNAINREPASYGDLVSIIRGRSSFVTTNHTDEQPASLAPPVRAKSFLSRRMVVTGGLGLALAASPFSPTYVSDVSDPVPPSYPVAEDKFDLVEKMTGITDPPNKQRENVVDLVRAITSASLKRPIAKIEFCNNPESFLTKALDITTLNQELNRPATRDVLQKVSNDVAEQMARNKLHVLNDRTLAEFLPAAFSRQSGAGKPALDLMGALLSDEGKFADTAAGKNLFKIYSAASGMIMEPAIQPNTPAQSRRRFLTPRTKQNHATKTHG